MLFYVRISYQTLQAIIQIIVCTAFQKLDIVLTNSIFDDVFPQFFCRYFYEFIMCLRFEKLTTTLRECNSMIVLPGCLHKLEHWSEDPISIFGYLARTTILVIIRVRVYVFL